jgi:hypothetical protein
MIASTLFDEFPWPVFENGKAGRGGLAERFPVMWREAFRIESIPVMQLEQVS